MAGETEVALIHLHRNGDKHRRRRGSVNQTGPTDNLPSSSGAPGLAFSSNTKRRGSIKGGKRKRKQDTDVKQASHNHRDKTTRQ